jgi:S1-C subfamily serine protease
VRFADDNQVPATIVGFDPFADAALLRVDPKGLTLRPLPFGQVNKLVVGAPVAAIGSPFGEEQSLSVGVISAIDRSIESLTGFATSGAIQTDAAINHGNSGGPLLNADGEVIGINSQIRSDSGDGTGVGFAVPADVVQRSLAQLRKGGTVHYAYLGISSREIYPQLAEHFGLPVKRGVWVQEVVPGGPGDRAGLKAGAKREAFQEAPYRVGGDIVVSIAGKPIRTSDDLAEVLAPLRPGQEVPVVVLRGKERKTLQVTLGERPPSAQ